MTAALVALAALNIFTGSLSIPAADVWGALTGDPATDATTRYVVLNSRVPQTLTAVLAGAALAAAGLMLQTSFANPLADPSILGINSGASLGAALVMLLFGGGMQIGSSTITGTLLVLAAAFAGAVAVIMLLTFFASILRSNLTLLIIGIMTGYAVSAIIELLYSVATQEGVHAFVLWGMGSFNGVTTESLPVFSVIIIAGLVLAMTMIKPLNALMLGENYAANLGISIRGTRIKLMLVTGMLAATATAFCGPVAFIGLAVPHIARFASGAAGHRTLMPLTMICGAAIAVACNLICYLPADGMQIPLNVVTSLWGVPVIIGVLLSSRTRRMLH